MATPTHFTQNCPHCRTKGAGFEVRYQWPVRGRGQLANILGVCGICNAGITIRSSSKHKAHENLAQNSVNFPGDHYQIKAIHPSFIDDIPDGIPSNISNFYSQGLKNLYERNWDAAGAMFRKTLDTSTKLLSPKNAKLNLFKRINTLVEDGLLTDSMGEWSHEIRMDGNDAVHDEEPETEEDAKRSQKFTEAFLTYAFSLPALVDSSRKGVDTTDSEVTDVAQ